MTHYSSDSVDVFCLVAVSYGLMWASGLVRCWISIKCQEDVEGVVKDNTDN